MARIVLQKDKFCEMYRMQQATRPDPELEAVLLEVREIKGNLSKAALINSLINFRPENIVSTKMPKARMGSDRLPDQFRPTENAGPNGDPSESNHFHRSPREGMLYSTILPENGLDEW